MNSKNWAAQSNFFRVINPELFEFMFSRMNVNLLRVEDDHGNTHYCVTTSSPKNNTFDTLNILTPTILFSVFDKSLSRSIRVQVPIDYIEDHSDDLNMSDNKAVVSHARDIIKKFLPDADIEFIVRCPKGFIDFDMPFEISTHLQRDSIAVFTEAEIEKDLLNPRIGLTGRSIAINNKGEKVELSLNDIYGLALKKFNVKEISTAGGTDVDILES